MSDSDSRIVFISTSVTPYTVPSRIEINKLKPDVAHVFAAKHEPGREWVVHSVPDNFHISPGFTLTLGKRFLYLPIGLPFLLYRLRPAVMVSEQLGPMQCLVLLYKIIFGGRVFLRWEGTPHTESAHGRIRKTLRKMLIHGIDGFLSFSPAADEYINSLVTDAKIERISYSADTSLFYPPDKLRTARNQFLFIGQLAHRKGCHLLIAAFLSLLDSHPQSRLIIAGSGSDEKKLKDMIPERWRGSFEFKGFVPAVEAADLMRQSSCLVCPTLLDHGPVVQIEAARTGITLVGSVYAGNSALVISPGVNGYIVDPTDVDSLCDAMIACMSLPLQSATQESIRLGSSHSETAEASTTLAAIDQLLERCS